MDELTRERYPDAPDWERYRRPLPIGRRRPPIPWADWATIEQRRRVLDEGLRVNSHRGGRRREMAE